MPYTGDGVFTSGDAEAMRMELDLAQPMGRKDT